MSRSSDSKPADKQLSNEQNEIVQKKTTPTRRLIDEEMLLVVLVELVGVELSLRNNELGRMAVSDITKIGLSLNKTVDNTVIKARYHITCIMTIVVVYCCCLLV